MPLGRITDRPGARRAVRCVGVAVAALLLLAAACSATQVTDPTALPSPSSSPVVNATRSVTFATPTAPEVGAPVVERVALSTQVDDDGAPLAESSVIQEEPGQVFLCVQVSQAQPGTQFRAVWFEAGQIIGQSDAVIEDGTDGSRWITLAYRPVFPLKPNSDHVVELFINRNLYERYAFRVGVGDPRRVIAEATFALGTDANGVVGAGSRFYMKAEQIVLVARISNMVDPTGMSFDTFWYRDDTVIAKIGPDGGQPQLSATPEPLQRRMTFTYRPGVEFTPGNYRVDLLLNGVRINSYRFTITAEEPPTPTPTPSPTPTPTPSPTPSPSPSVTPSPGRATPTVTGTPNTGEAQVDDVVISDEIDPGTGAPIGNVVFVWEADPGSLVTLWVCVAVRDLSEDDELLIVVYQDDEQYGMKAIETEDLAAGWLATTVALDVPPDAGGEHVYTVVVLLNGEESLSTSMLMAATE